MPKSKLRALLAGAAATLLAALVVAAALIWSGAYNVAASSGHSALARLVFGATMERSVKARAGGEAPMLDAAAVRAGGGE